MKTCSKCGDTKSVDGFRLMRRSYGYAYRTECKSCEKVYNGSVSRKQRRNQRRAWRYQNDSGYRERVLKYAAWKYASDSDFRCDTRRRARKFAQTTKGKALLSSKNSYQRTLRDPEVIGRWTQDDVLTRLDEQNDMCVGCDRLFGDDLPYTLGHKIPVSKGGVCSADNLVLQCRSCNSSQRDRDYEEWLPKRRAQLGSTSHLDNNHEI